MAYKRKYNAKKRTARKAPYKKRSTMNRTKLVSLIKRTVLKRAEAKEKQVAFEKVEMYHNCFHNGINPISTGLVIKVNSGVLPTQGVGDNQRVGDEIYLSGFKFKMLVGQKADRPNVTFRYLVLSVPKGSSITYSDWFKATIGNVLLDEPNKDFVKTLKTGLWRPNEAGLSATGAREYTYPKELYIPYKKKLKFGPADAAITHNDDDLYLVIMAYDAFGTQVTDNIGYITPLLICYYRDP